MRDATDLIRVCRGARLAPAAYRFYRAILRHFAEQGGPPDPSHLRRLARRFGVPLAATLADLAAQDLVQRDPATGAIRAAYPFSGVPTTHRVALAPDRASGDLDRTGGEVFAMCALDALGIPLMLRRGAMITSRDALTGAPIAVTVTVIDGGALGRAGRWSARWDPAGAVVLARPERHELEHDCGREAAAVCCPLTNFFASAAHARRWAEMHPVGDAVVMGRARALRCAHALFGGLLDRLEDEQA
jgi:hypothetical protein